MTRKHQMMLSGQYLRTNNRRIEIMTDKEKKRLHDIKNVPVDEEKLKNDRKNAVYFKQETTYELTIEE